MKPGTIRRWHAYIGLFTAPSVLFFALTGAVQLFSLHEAHGDYHPAALIEKLSSVHKDQVFALGDHHGPPDEGSPPGEHRGPPDESSPPGDHPGAPKAGQPPGGPEDHDEGPSVPAFLLKGFFLIAALSLSASTGFGVWMGLTQTPRKKLGWSLLAAGAFIPIVLLLIST